MKFCFTQVVQCYFMGGWNDGWLDGGGEGGRDMRTDRILCQKIILSADAFTSLNVYVYLDYMAGYCVLGIISVDFQMVTLYIIYI